MIVTNLVESLASHNGVSCWIPRGNSVLESLRIASIIRECSSGFLFQRNQYPYSKGISILRLASWLEAVKKFSSFRRTPRSCLNIPGLQSSRQLLFPQVFPGSQRNEIKSLSVVQWDSRLISLELTILSRHPTTVIPWRALHACVRNKRRCSRCAALPQEKLRNEAEREWDSGTKRQEKLFGGDQKTVAGAKSISIRWLTFATRLSAPGEMQLLPKEILFRWFVRLNDFPGAPRAQ